MMGGMYPMGGMPGMMPGFGMPPGLISTNDMGMGGMYGMGMPMMGMNLGESIDQPLSSDGLEDLWSTEDSANEEKYGLEMTQAEVRQDSFDINELIGVDEDGDGFDAYDELITDHVDSDPDDKPTQAEVDAAYEKYEELGWNALEEKLAGTFDKDSEDTPYAPDQDEIDSMLGLDVPGADSENMTDQARLDEALSKVSYFYPSDELALRRVTIHRVIGENRQRSLFDRVITDDSGVWQRLRPTGLIHNTTDPRTGFSTLKWMELLNYSGTQRFSAKDTFKDGANRRLQFRLSSTRTDRDDKSILHQFIRGGDKYEIAFAVSQTKGVDQRDQRGRTALHVAAALGSLDTVKVLLELGAAPAAVDDYGFNALHWAAQQGRMDGAAPRRAGRARAGAGSAAAHPGGIGQGQRPRSRQRVSRSTIKDSRQNSSSSRFLIVFVLLCAPLAKRKPFGKRQWLGTRWRCRQRSIPAPTPTPGARTATQRFTSRPSKGSWQASRCSLPMGHALRRATANTPTRQFTRQLGRIGRRFWRICSQLGPIQIRETRTVIWYRYTGRRIAGSPNCF